MSCIGSSSTARSNKRKGKEIAVDEPLPVVAEEEQLRKGKDLAEESDGSGSNSDSDSGTKSEWESDLDLGSDSEDEQQQQENKKPVWLDRLLRTKFWDPCKLHGSKNRADQCMFCLKCFKVTCPHCNHNKPGHRLLKIRRYVFRSVVHASDMQELGIDISRIQTYVINARKVMHLRPMNRSKYFRPQAGTPRCITCRTWLRSAPNSYCSLVCEGDFNVSQDDFSGPEAEVRYRSLQANMAKPSSEAAEELPAELEAEHAAPAQVDEPPPPPAANQNVSLRKRARKQAKPGRAPFF